MGAKPGDLEPVGEQAVWVVAFPAEVADVDPELCSSGMYRPIVEHSGCTRFSPAR